MGKEVEGLEELPLEGLPFTQFTLDKKETMKRSETLKYHGNLSPSTIQKMKECRLQFIKLARYCEEIGESRELSAAFTAIEHAQMLAIKHLCMVDPQAVQEDPFFIPPPIDMDSECCKETKTECCGSSCTADSTLADVGAA